MTTFQQHVAHVNKQDHSLYLGRLVWYSIGELCVDHAAVVQELIKAGLGSILPPPPRDHDVFRRVTTHATLKKVQTGKDGVFENYLIREVAGRGDDVITRRVVCEIVNRVDKQLNYKAELLDIEFERDNGTLSFKWLSPSMEHTLLPDGTVNPRSGSAEDKRRIETCLNITNYIKREYANWKGKLGAYAVREYIRRTLYYRFGATMVREGGGVYFVPEARAHQVAALETFTNNVSPAAKFHSLPLLDDQKQRNMVKEAFQAETVDEIDKLMAEIREIHAAGTKLSSDRYTKILDRYRELTSKTKEYGSVLEQNVDEVNTRLSLFQAAVLQLTTQVRKAVV